jgi:hypothetical protein
MRSAVLSSKRREKLRKILFSPIFACNARKETLLSWRLTICLALFRAERLFRVERLRRSLANKQLC